MPIGVILNAAAILIGGLIGAVIGNRLSDDFCDKLNMVFACCSFGMGISSVILMQNMPAIFLSVIVGTIIGLALHLGDRIQKVARWMVITFSKFERREMPQTQERIDNLVTIIVIFCFSATGVYGSLAAGMSGDHSILISKSILDLFTAAIFACSLGKVVSLISIPQFFFFLLMFFCAGLIMPLATPYMINDFKACGGVIIFATALRMAKIRNFPIADMLPALVLVMPLSWVWVNWILPMLG